MSGELNAIVEVASKYSPVTVTLSPESVAVLFYAQSFLSQRENWFNQNTGEDDILEAEWLTIRELVAGANKELMTPMIGQIMSFATATLPTNVIPCDGGLYLRTDYPDLYELLPAALIVDGSSFRTPDIRSRVVIGSGQGSGLSQRNELVNGGLESVAISTGELPSHNHSSPLHGHSDAGHFHTEAGAIPTVITVGEIPFPVPVSAAAPTITGLGNAQITPTSVTIDFTGSNEAHENMPPFIALQYGMVAR